MSSEREAKYTSVKCPVCDAPIGVGCVDVLGNRSGITHKSRMTAKPYVPAPVSVPSEEDRTGDNEPPTCALCGEEFTLVDGDVAPKYCDPCAQIRVMELESAAHPVPPESGEAEVSDEPIICEHCGERIYRDGGWRHENTDSHICVLGATPKLSNSHPPAGSATFEEWWLAYGPSQGNQLFKKDGMEYLYDLMRNQCHTAWLAARQAQPEPFPRWVEFVERFEDMSPDGRMRIFRQQDGDVILTGIGDDSQQVSLEFCAPMTGGGQSEKTWIALMRLAEAMEEDNNSRPQSRPLPPPPQKETEHV